LSRRGPPGKIVTQSFDGPAVRERLLRIVEDEDLRRYIL
jgi:hypothetical protein